MNNWSKTSKEKLETCHPDIIKIMNVVLQIHDCAIVSGMRGEAEQNELYRNGASKLKFPNSKHNGNPSMAVDVIPFYQGKGTWDRERIILFSGLVIGVSNVLFDSGQIEHRIRWGGTWSVDVSEPFARFFDGAHFELYK